MILKFVIIVLKQACVVVFVDLHLAFLVELQQPVAVLVVAFACQYSLDLAALVVLLVADSSDFVASWDKWSFAASLLY